MFRYCVNPTDMIVPAPVAGVAMEVRGIGVGIAIGVVMLRWRSMPWWLASIVVVAACLGTALLRAVALDRHPR